MTARLLGVAVLLPVDAAHAHPGHGASPAASWFHGLEPVHLAPFALALAAALLARNALRRRAAARGRPR